MNSKAMNDFPETVLIQRIDWGDDEGPRTQLVRNPEEGGHSGPVAKYRLVETGTLTNNAPTITFTEGRQQA